MPFTEICIYQVKPQKTEEFEALLSEAKSLLEKQEGLLMLRLIKRGYHIDMEQIKEGLPPLQTPIPTVSARLFYIPLPYPSLFFLAGGFGPINW